MREQEYEILEYPNETWALGLGAKDMPELEFVLTRDTEEQFITHIMSRGGRFMATPFYNRSPEPLQLLSAEQVQELLMPQPFSVVADEFTTSPLETSLSNNIVAGAVYRIVSRHGGPALEFMPSQSPSGAATSHQLGFIGYYSSYYIEGASVPASQNLKSWFADLKRWVEARCRIACEASGSRSIFVDKQMDQNTLNTSLSWGMWEID